MEVTGVVKDSKFKNNRATKFIIRRFFKFKQKSQSSHSSVWILYLNFNIRSLHHWNIIYAKVFPLTHFEHQLPKCSLWKWLRISIQIISLHLFGLFDLSWQQRLIKISHLHYEMNFDKQWISHKTNPFLTGKLIAVKKVIKTIIKKKKFTIIRWYQRSLIYLRSLRLHESERRLETYPWLNVSLINSIAFTKQSKRQSSFWSDIARENLIFERNPTIFILPFYIRWEWSAHVEFCLLKCEHREHLTHFRPLFGQLIVFHCCTPMVTSS